MTAASVATWAPASLLPSQAQPLWSLPLGHDHNVTTALLQLTCPSPHWDPLILPNPYSKPELTNPLLLPELEMGQPHFLQTPWAYSGPELKMSGGM